MGGGGQAEAGLLGRWLAKKSKQNATTSQKVADKLARLSPKSLLTVFKKNAGLQPLPVGNGSTVSASFGDDIDSEACTSLFVKIMCCHWWR